MQVFVYIFELTMNRKTSEMVVSLYEFSREKLENWKIVNELQSMYHFEL